MNDLNRPLHFAGEAEVAAAPGVAAAQGDEVALSAAAALDTVEERRAFLERLLDEVKLEHDSVPEGWTEKMAAAAVALDGIAFEPELGRLIADCRMGVASGFYYAGLMPFALEQCEASLRIAEACNEPRSVRRALGVSGVILGEMGEIATAIDRSLRAHEMAQELDDANGVMVMLVNLSAVAICASRCEEAVAVADRGLAHLVRLLHDGVLTHDEGETYVSMLRANKADGLVRLGRLEEARVAIEGIAGRVPTSRRLVQLDIERLAVDILLRNGDVAGAAARLPAILALRGADASLRNQLVIDLCEGMVLAHSGEDRGFALLDSVRERSRGLAGLYVDAVYALILAYDSGVRPYSSEPLRDLLSTSRKSRQIGFMALRNLRRHQGVKRLDDEPWVVLRRVAISATLADDPSGEHPFRVAELARRIAVQIGLPHDEVQSIERGALLHDVGKCTLPARKVWRRGESEAEHERMQRSHADAGAELIVLGEVPDFEVARDIARHHHERWDGTGFPDQLAGAGIPLAARIVAVADRFDVLTEPRFGAPSRSSSEALDAMRAASGSEFAPKMVEALEGVVARLPADASQRRAVLAAEAFRSPDWRAVMALGRMGEERAKAGP